MNIAPQAKAVAIGAVVTGLYFVAGRIGLGLAFFHTSASPVWPPTGIALATLLLLGRGYWPSILLGAFLVNVTANGGVATSAAIAVGNTMEGLIGERDSSSTRRHGGLGLGLAARTRPPAGVNLIPLERRLHMT